VDAKLQAIAAYRSQCLIQPAMLPAEVFVDLFGAEYFLPVGLLDEGHAKITA
jgi:hypothetical protein